jgi:hypothetical protein
MKMKLSILVMLFSFLSIEGYCQEKTKKELKAERELQAQKETEALVDSKKFVFDAEKLTPQSGRLLILDYNTYFLKFNQDIVNCDLPFFGRGFNVGYGSDGGIKFEGKPENLKIEKTKKYYIVKMTVKGKDDVYDVFFKIFFNKQTTLSINSNNRSSISYDGRIRAFKADEKINKL